MAEHREREHGRGAPGGEDLRDWTHTHGAGGGDPDPEVSVRGVLWTAGGVTIVTAVSMVLMIWLLGGLRELRTAGEPAPTPAEAQRRDAVLRAAEEGRAAEPVPMPSLALPPAYELPPAPRLELVPGYDLGELRKVEARLLGCPDPQSPASSRSWPAECRTWAWTDEEAGEVRIPIEVAIELAAAGELPGVPRGAPPAEGMGPAAEAAADRALDDHAESDLGTTPVPERPEESMEEVQ